MLLKADNFQAAVAAVRINRAVAVSVPVVAVEQAVL
jgi:hypothetical protein